MLISLGVFLQTFEANILLDDEYFFVFFILMFLRDLKGYRHWEEKVSPWGSFIKLFVRICVLVKVKDLASLKMY